MIKLLCAAFVIVIAASAVGHAFLIPGFTLQAASGDPTVGLLPADRSAWANWKMAGLQSVGGISAIDGTRANCTTAQAGITMPITPIGGGSDDSSNIQTAINNCPVDTVVTLAAGSFNVGEGNYLFVDKQITLRGAGACAGTAIGAAPYPTSSQSYCTLIYRSNGVQISPPSGQQSGAGGTPTAHIYMGGADTGGTVTLNTNINLAADGAQGSSTIQVTDNSSFSANMIVLISETSNLGWQTGWIWSGVTQWSSPDYRLGWRAQNPTCAPGDEVCAGGSTPPSIPCYFSFNETSDFECDRYTNEIKNIKSIGAGPCPGVSCTVTFDSPLMMSYRAAQTAHIAAIYGKDLSHPVMYYIGVENMTLQNADGSSVVMDACAYCWVQNVENDVMSGYYGNGSIAVEGCFRSQLEGVYLHYGAYPFPGGAGYNLSLDKGSSEILIENSISTTNDKVMVARKSGAGSVVAYNYFDESILGGGSGESEVGANASHWMGSHHVLFEGNWSYSLDGDGTWGSDTDMTWIRNWATGFRTTFYDYMDQITINDAANIPGAIGGNNYVRGVSVAGSNYWHSFVGNVIGTSGLMSGWTYHSPGAALTIWGEGGFGGDGAHTDPEMWSQQGTAGACVVAATGDQCPFIRLSNYDYVTNSLNDPSNPTVPQSFYITGAPAYFNSGSGYTWPWVNSQGTTKVQSGPTTANCTTNVGGPCSGLPAKARIDNGTPFVQP